MCARGVVWRAGGRCLALSVLWVCRVLCVCVLCGVWRVHCVLWFRARCANHVRSVCVVRAVLCVIVVCVVCGVVCDVCVCALCVSIVCVLRCALFVCCARRVCVGCVVSWCVVCRGVCVLCVSCVLVYSASAVCYACSVC